jgi:SPP1 family predicted phage head-tail adaptor
MPIAAGDLDRRITIERFTTGTNALNEEVRSWGTLATVWASMRPLYGSERLAAQEVSAQATTQFRIRWAQSLKDLSPLDRLRYDNKVFEISEVREIGRREGLEIIAAARAERTANV